MVLRLKPTHIGLRNLGQGRTLAGPSNESLNVGLGTLGLGAYAPIALVLDPANQAQLQRHALGARPVIHALNTTMDMHFDAYQGHAGQ